MLSRRRRQDIETGIENFEESRKGRKEKSEDENEEIEEKFSPLHFYFRSWPVHILSSCFTIIIIIIIDIIIIITTIVVSSVVSF